MVNPTNPTSFIPVPQALLDTPVHQLSDAQRVQRDWTQFEEGEQLIIKGIAFRIHEIGESRMVLKFA